MRFNAKGTYIKEIVSNDCGNLDILRVRPVRAHFLHRGISRDSSQDEQTHFTISFGEPGLDFISPLSSNSSNKRVRREKSL